MSCVLGVTGRAFPLYGKLLDREKEEMKLRGFEFDKVVGLIVKGGMMGMTHAQGLPWNWKQ